MTELDIETIERLFRTRGEVPNDEDEQCDYDWDEWNTSEVIEIPGVGMVKTVENVGGEGQGDYAAYVFEVTGGPLGNRHFRKEGYHSSYSGTTWDGAFERVVPVAKTITVYEPVG